MIQEHSPTSCSFNLAWAPVLLPTNAFLLSNVYKINLVNEEVCRFQCEDCCMERAGVNVLNSVFQYYGDFLCLFVKRKKDP